MKIVCIFAKQLFAFKYENEPCNAFDFAMELWTDVNYLYSFALKNNIANIDKFVEETIEDVEQIQDLLIEIELGYKRLSDYFEPLQLKERKVKLGFHKGKIRQNNLRMYALKIDEEMFVITGAAIKMSQKMEAHIDTINELKKLNQAKAFLVNEDIVDEASFYELTFQHL